jgi:hypothetical protein
MKKIEKFIVCVFLLFSCQIVFSQYGNNGYGNGYGNGGYGGGMNRSGMESTPSAPKPVPVEETVAKAMVKIKTELNLDALQEIAISNVLIDNMKAQGVIIKREGSQEDKVKDITVLSETTDRKIKEYLNPEQKEKYIILCEEAKNPKASKKKKK